MMFFCTFSQNNLWISIFLCFLSLNSIAAKPQQYLKLQDVLFSVTHCYPQIKIARLEINKAHGEYISAIGKFDPSINLDTRSQPIGGYISNYGDTEFDVPTLYNGVKLFAGYRNGRGDWPIYYQNYLTNSGGEYRTGLSLPLLRDRVIDKDRARLLTKSETIRIKQHDAAATKIKIYQETIKAYWQWVAAGLQVKIFKHLFELAEVRQKAVVQQATQGDAPRLAMAENLQQMLQRQQLLNQGKMLFEQAAINLSLYYRDKEGNPKKPSARDLPPYLSEQPVKPQESMLQLEHHPQLRKLRNYSKIIKLKQNLAKNELLPYLDGTAYTFKQNGTGGYPLLIPQAAMIGVSFKFPVFQRQAKGKLISATRELEQICAERKFLYERLKNELTNLFIGIRIYHQQVRLLHKELNLAHQVQSGETKKFYEGDSTLFLVNQREQTTTQVQLNLINAEVKLQEMNDLVRFFSSAQAVS
ncbi:MAG: TolC family protein [Legionellaceae bacterium]|nr:TolC family protein [Legionellaceae bacterium]